MQRNQHDHRDCGVASTVTDTRLHWTHTYTHLGVELLSSGAAGGGGGDACRGPASKTREVDRQEVTEGKTGSAERGGTAVNLVLHPQEREKL